MGRAIFISYRRDDTEGEAGRLFDDLVRSFGEDSVFMDVAGINPGMDFRKAIDDNVANCGVLLAIIGPAWCSILRNTETHICEILADRGVRWAYRKKTGNDPLPEIVGDIKAWSAFTDHDIDAYWGLKAWPAV